MKHHLPQATYLLAAAAGALLAGAAVRADVTIEQKTSLDVASFIRTHGASTTNITADKKREDTESHCEGVMSLVCGNVRSGEIVRLDRGLTWHLEPAKKSYREDIFATPQELALMRSKLQERLEKMRSCPVSEKQQPIDKSKCEMSPPKIDVHKTEDKASIAGHDAQRTLATLTETCNNKETGDVCDTVVALDVWLTQDKVPGADERREFDLAYGKKLGLLDEQGVLAGDYAKFLAPYQAQIKQLTGRSSDLKGLPLKTSLRVLVGGQQCSTTAKMKTNDSAAAGNSAEGNPMNDVAHAGKAIGSALGALFHKKKADESQESSNASAPAESAAPTSTAADPYAQLVQMAAFSSETVSISSGTVAADRFEVPADWKKDVPKESKRDEEFTCPKTGS